MLCARGQENGARVQGGEPEYKNILSLILYHEVGGLPPKCRGIISYLHNTIRDSNILKQPFSHRNLLFDSKMCDMGSCKRMHIAYDYCVCVWGGGDIM